MQTTTVSVRSDMLKSLSSRSTTYMPRRFITLATQKNMPLIITEGMPDFYIYTKAKDTKEL